MGLGHHISWKGLFAVVVWGASFVATRIVLEDLGPFHLVAARLLAGAALLAFMLKLRGGRMAPIRRDVPVCLFLGGTLAAHLLIQAHGLQYTSAINTGWIIGFIPVTIAVGAQLLGQQRLGAGGWAGVAVGTAGVLLVTMRAPPNFADAHFGDVLQVTSCLTWTIYTLAGAGAITRNGALRVTTFTMGVAALIVTIATSFVGLPAGPVAPAAWLSLAFLGFICSGIAYYLWFSATDRYGPTRVAALLYFEPFVTLAAATAAMREPVTTNAVVGGMIVLVGVWLVSRGARRRVRRDL